MTGRADIRWEQQAPDDGGRTTVLNRLSLCGAVAGAALLAYAILIGQQGLDLDVRLLTLAPFIGSWFIVLVVGLWQGLGYWTRSVAVLLAGYVVGGVLLARHGLSGSGGLWLAGLPSLVFVLLGERFGQLAALFSILFYAALSFLVSQGWAPPIMLDTGSLEPWVRQGGHLVILMAASLLVLSWFDGRWSARVNEADGVRKQLKASKERLVDLTKQLRHQSAQWRAAAGVARDGASPTDLHTLADDIVKEILDGFDSLGITSAMCLLLDESADALILKARAGNEGTSSLGVGERLGLDRRSRSAVASVVLDGEDQVLTSVEEGVEFGRGASAQGLSEIVLPLRSSGATLGAIRLLSDLQVEDLTSNQSDLDHLRAVVDQGAVAIQNVQLLSQTRAALEELEALRRRYVTEQWSQFLAQAGDLRVDYGAPGVEGREDDFLRQARRQAVEQNRPVVRKEGPPGSGGEPDQAGGAMIVPLRLRGRPIGTITLHGTRRDLAWTEDDVVMAETMAQEIAQTIETLRLMDESRRHLARERMVGEVAASMRESLDVEAVLKTGAVEIREAMGLSAVTVRLAGVDDDEGDGLAD